MRFKRWLNEEEKGVGFSSWPDGWDNETLEQWAQTFAENHGGLTPGEEGWFDECVSAMEDEEGINNPEAFCAAVKDEYLNRENWRGED